jgi:hypothetical protein
VLGIVEGGGGARHVMVKSDLLRLDLTGFNDLVDEGKWANQEACCATMVPTAGGGVVGTFEDGSPAIVLNEFGQGKVVTIGFDAGLVANNLNPEGLHALFDELLAGLCRKVYDTHDYQVEAGMWHNDAGQRLLILVNHDAEAPHTVKLPDGKEVTIQPWRAYTWTSE